MLQPTRTTRSPKRRISLTVYISLLLAFTAIGPLLVTIGSLEFFLRPALISQIRSDIEKDTQMRIQLIDAYFAERLNDVKTLSESTAVKDLLSGDRESSALASNVLFNAQHRDVVNYISISLLNTQGNNVILTYPVEPLKHGNYYIVPQALQQIQQSSKIVISNVFYDQVGNAASVDLYVRVVSNDYHLLGFVRASLGLHRIWEPVDTEPQINGTGSYATILDQNGVRIAYTNPDHSGFTHPKYLFTSVSPIRADLQQQIKDEDLYGNSGVPVTALPDQQLADVQHLPTIFQAQYPEQSQSYEAARVSSTIVPWTYILFKPTHIVTGLADQQLLSIIAIIVLILVAAVPIGVITGRRISLPILRSVSALRDNSQSLKTLATEEHVVAKEQSWMVEASLVAQKSVKYYTKATGVAAQRIHALGTELARNSQRVDARRFHQALHDIVEAAAYIERAIQHQENVNEKLDTVLRVTTQATEQLTQGAKSTDDAAAQLEYIVDQLTAVVGKKK
jgi:hypothetical protein